MQKITIFSSLSADPPLALNPEDKYLKKEQTLSGTAMHVAAATFFCQAKKPWQKENLKL